MNIFWLSKKFVKKTKTKNPKNIFNNIFVNQLDPASTRGQQRPLNERCSLHGEPVFMEPVCEDFSAFTDHKPGSSQTCTAVHGWQQEKRLYFQNNQTGAVKVHRLLQKITKKTSTWAVVKQLNTNEDQINHNTKIQWKPSLSLQIIWFYLTVSKHTRRPWQVYWRQLCSQIANQSRWWVRWAEFQKKIPKIFRGCPL